MDLNTSLYGLLFSESQHYLKERSLYFMGKETSYKDLLYRIDCFASALVDLGIKEGDCVSICMPNVPQTLYAIYACNKIGAICNIIHPLTPSSQLEYFMEFCESKLLIILDISYRYFTKNIEKYPTIIASITDELSWIKSKVYAHTIKKDTKDIVYQGHVYHMKDLLTKYQPTPIEQKNRGQKAAVYLHSSGTTGKPKTIVLSNYSINACAEQSSYIMERMNFVGTSMLSILPMFHGFGLAMNAHNMLILGGSCTLMPRFNAKQVAKLINKNRVNYIVGVPTLFEALLKEKKFTESKHLKNLIQTFVGGDFPHPSLKDDFNQLLASKGSDARLLEGYGSTETVTVNCVNRASEEKVGTMGKPLRGYQVKIIDLVTKETLRCNQDGEICVSCDAIMMGYLKDDAATKAVIEKDKEGLIWVRSGDLGSIDEEGYVYLKSRLKRIVKVSGVPVFPSEVERIISLIEEVDRVCAVAMQDEKKGNAIKVYVTLKHSELNKPEIEAKITKVCKENLILYARPKMIVFIDKMPLTNTNKIDYRSLEGQTN